MNMSHKFFRKSRMLISVFLGLVLCIIEGTAIVWSSPILKKLNNTDDNPLHRVISTDESSLLASLPVFGSIFASCLLMTISSKLGRKPLLALHGMVSLVSYLTLAFSANIWCYYVARFISGLTAAAITVILPLYICELADSSSRGSLSAGMIVSVNGGILLAFMGGPFIPFIWYHSLMALMSIGFIISFSFFALESPYYFPKGDSSRIEVLLRKLRGVDDVTDEVNAIKRCLKETSEENFFEQIKLKGSRKAFMLGVGIVTLSTASGANVVITYAQVIFDSAGGNWSGEVCNIIVGVVQLVVSIIAAIVMDKFQRKHIMIISASFQAISMALLSLYLILKDKGVDVEAFGWAPLLCFLGYVSFYNIGVGPLWKTVLGEILPQGIKNTAMSFCSLWYGGIVFMLTFTFQRIEQSIGLGETLIFFSIISLSTAVYVAIFIVETKGKTLAEIQLELNAESDICTFALRKNHFVTKQELTTNLFSVDTRPECLKVLYSAASKTPVAVMRQLDRWRRDGHRSSRFFMCTPVLGQRRKRIKCNGDIEIETRVPAAVEELRRWTSTEALGDITVTPDCPNRIPPNVSQCTADGDDLTDGTALSDDEGLDHKLPSPEEQVQVVALKFPSEMVTVDISGRPFDRMSLQRRSLMNGEIPTRDGDADKKKTKTRRPRSKRRSTLAGTDQKEIQSAVTAGTSQPTSSSAQESIAPPIKTVGRSKSSDILRSSSKKESPETKRSHFNTLKQWSKNRYDRLMNRSNEDKYKDKDIDEFNLYETVTMKRRRNVDKKLSLHQRSSSVSSSEKSSVNLPISSTLSGVMNIAVRLRESSLQRRERRKGRNKDEPHSSSGNWSASSESGRNSLGSEITSSTIQPKSTTSTATSNNSLNLPVPGSICGRRRFVNASASSSVTSEGTLTPDIIHDLHEDGETSSVYSCDTEGYYTSFHMDSGLKTLKEEELPPTPLHISNTLDFPSNSAENEYELFGKGSTSTTTSSAGTICTTLRASESNRSLIIGPAVPERKSSLNSKYPDGSLERDESSEKTGTVKRSPATTKAIINAEDKRSDGGISPDSGHNTSSSPIESTNSPNGVRSGSEFEFSESSDMEGPERIERIRVKTTINSSRIPSMCVITPSPSDDESSQSSRNSNRNEEPRDRNFENGKNRISGTNKFISVDQNTGYATLETIQTKPTEKCTDINRNAASITTNNSVRAPSPSGGTVIIRDEVPIPKTNQPIFKSTLLPFNNMFDKIKTNLSNLKHRKEDKSPNRNQSSDNKECDNGEYVTIADVRNNNNKTVGNDENSYVNDIVNKNLKTILSGKIKETEYVSLNELPCNETNIENPLSNIDSLERKKRQGARVTLDAEGKVVYTSDSLKRKKGLQTTFEPGPFVKTTSPKPSPLPSHRIPKNVRAVTQTDRGLPDGSVPVPSQLGKVIIKASSDASHEIIRMPPATIVGPNKRPMSPKLSGRGAYVHVQDAGKPQEKERVPLSPERQMYQSVPEFGQPVDMSRYQRVLYDQNPTHVYHDQYYLGRGTQYQTLPTKKTQLYYGDIQPERSVTPDITRGLERHEDLHMDYPGFEKVGLQSFYNESRIYADNTHRDDALLNQKLGIPIAIPQLHNFNDSNPSSSIIHPNNSLVQTNQLNPSISPMKEQLNRTDQVDYSFKISPIDPRSAGCFQSSTPSQIPPLKGAVNLESKIMSPKKSTMSNEELYAVIHKSKKRMNIKTEEENRSPVRTFDNNTQIEKVKTPESGYLGDRVRTRLSWSPNTQNECDIRELHVDSVPTESRSRQSWAYNDRKKVPQTSRLDFKKLLLQKSSNLLSNTKKPSAVEQLKLSKEQIQQRPFSPPVQPPGMNILELSGSPRSLVNRRFANPSSSPKHTVDKIKPAKLMSPRSQWRFASPRSDVLSSTILEDCREDETNSSGEKKPSPVRLETKFDDQGTTSSTNPVKYNTEPRRRYATIAERMQAQRAEFFNTGSSSSNQFTNNQTPKEKSKIPALETSF